MTDTTDDWITWTGGECPIPDAKSGEFGYILRSGEVIKDTGCDAIDYLWNHKQDCNDFIAYRLNTPAPDILEQLIAAGGDKGPVEVESEWGGIYLAFTNPAPGCHPSSLIIVTQPDGSGPFGCCENGTSSKPRRPTITRVIPPRRSEFQVWRSPTDIGAWYNVKQYCPWGWNIGQLERIWEGDQIVAVDWHPAGEDLS